MDAEAVIATLGLRPHPEGGWFARTFREAETGGRWSAIYFLLKAGERSHWHRIRNAAEIWHHYAGAPLRLETSADAVMVESCVLGSDLASGQRPQALVPAGYWQQAASLGAWTLAGCTVSPAFEFEAFELAPPDWRPGFGSP